MKKTIVAVLVLAVLALLAVKLWPKPDDPGTSPGGNGPDVVTNGPQTGTGTETDTPEENPPEGSVVIHATHRPLEPEATKRLHEGPVIVTSFFEAKGKGEWADKGVAARGIYLYTIGVKAKSEVLDKKEEAATGEIFVKERRTFMESRDTISMSEADAALALDTLPVDQVHDWVMSAGGLVASIAAKLGQLQVAAGAGVAVASVDGWYRTAKAIDGTSIREMLGWFGVKIPPVMDDWASQQLEIIVKDALEKSKVRSVIQSIEGKSFLITYTQEASGKPLNIQYENEDGFPISEEECEILRQANLFLDQDMVPDTRKEIGQSWNVWADEIQSLFGLSSTGRAEGEIVVTRGPDKDGDWTLELEGTEISFRSDDGSTSGHMTLKEGNGLVDGTDHYVKALHATATGSLASMNRKRHAMFFEFVTRLDGKANLRFSLVTDPLRQDEP